MTYKARSEELDHFKTQIYLCEYAASRGYLLDRKKSSRRAAVMRHANGDRLIISRGPNGHWQYFNPHDDRDRGTIIDFVQTRDRVSLGEVRKTLRAWKHSSAARPRIHFAAPATGKHDRGRVQREWDAATPLRGGHDYLERRGIPRAVLAAPAFAGQLRAHARGNALFAHHDEHGLAGFEIKNRGFTGFATGGAKALFRSRPDPSSSELVVCETAVDALSYAALFGFGGRRFLSTAGQPSPKQLALLHDAVRSLPPDGRVVLAVDNDAGGRRIAEVITRPLQIACAGRPIQTHVPDAEGQDWNDMLRCSRSLRCRPAGLPAPER